ncbi:hypothetical protein ACXYRK_02600 [Mycoplasma sp. AC1221]
MDKFLKKLKDLHWSQWVYIILWTLFIVFLIILIGLFGGFTENSHGFSREKLGAHYDAYVAAFKKFRSDVIGAMGFLFFLSFFGAIIATIASHGFFLKKKKLLLAKAGGK